MGIAGRLAHEPGRARPRQPADAPEAARTAHPRLVVQRVEQRGFPRRGIDRIQEAVFVVVGTRDDEPVRARVVPAASRHPHFALEPLGPRVEPGHLARGGSQQADSASIRRVSDLAAGRTVGRVARPRDPLRHARFASLVARRPRHEQNVQPVGGRIERGDALVGGEVYGLGTLVAILARFGGVFERRLPADVLEQFELLLLEILPMPLGLLVLSWGAAPDVGELPDRTALEAELVEIVAGAVQDAAPLGRETRRALGLSRVGQPLRRLRGPIDQVEIPVVLGHPERTVGRNVARREEDVGRIALAFRNRLGVTAGYTHPEELPLGLPVGAARKPAEVEPGAVVGPADVLRRLSDQLRAAHDLANREGECVLAGRFRLPGRYLRRQFHRGGETEHRRGCQRRRGPRVQTRHSFTPRAAPRGTRPRSARAWSSRRRGRRASRPAIAGGDRSCPTASGR